MKPFAKYSLLAGVLAAAIAAAGCNQLKARDQLNRGVQAFKNAQFNQAIENFQTAIQLDPTLVNAKIYLATAYQAQFIPGAPSEDNLKLAQQAMDEYKVILDQQPDNANAVAGIARLDYDMNNLDEAESYYKKSLTINPNDPSAYYTLGAIAYQKTNRGIVTARTSLGVTDLNAPMVPAKKAPPNAKKQCEALASQDSAIIDDGIAQLNKALQLRPDYDDAMTYLNLLYREKGDLTCGNDTERQADLKIASDFAARGIAARKAAVARANKQGSGGVVIDTKPN
ncbi:MAG TPA: tetratricopeptide repeat protein [Terriglobales bacterium]|nr:tetratricopeptide repeat protein [Terriglobales bacterium]